MMIPGNKVKWPDFCSTACRPRPGNGWMPLRDSFAGRTEEAGMQSFFGSKASNLLASEMCFHNKRRNQMDNKAFYKLSYGVFMLASKADGKTNACITNTCIQVANSPTRVAFAVINTNYTCEFVKKSGLFTMSLLSKSCSFDLIRHFGMQSGRNVDKMGSIQFPVDDNGIPYLGWSACAVLSGKVVDSIDLGSHTLFIAEVTDAKVLSDEEPLTYAYYQSDVKPKPEKKKEDRRVKAWRCKICGYVYEGSELPADFSCPLCGHGPEDFEPVYE